MAKPNEEPEARTPAEQEPSAEKTPAKMHAVEEPPAKTHAVEGPSIEEPPVGVGETQVEEPIVEGLVVKGLAAEKPIAGAPTSGQLAELEHRWLRAVADAENLRKRYASRLPREMAAQRDRVVAAWLPVVDNLDRALAHAGGDDSAIAAGIQAVRDQAVEVLARLGYARHEETGVPFDPQRHEAVTVVRRDDVKPHTVVQVVRPGYGDGERQLRPAAVVVAGQE